MQNNSRVQSQSAASGMPPESGAFGSMMQGFGSQLMSQLDANNNGSIDKAEFSNAAKQLAKSASTSANNAFSSIDANKDGSIDANELMNVLKQALTKQKSDAIAARLQNSNVTQTSENTQASNKNNMQSILMKSILSAYGTSNTAMNSGSISLKA
jgi:hypothetical protein